MRDDNYAAEIRQLVTDYDRQLHQARTPGVSASSLGHECDRFLAMTAMNEPTINPTDPYLAALGTAWHAYMEKVLTHDNEQLTSPAPTGFGGPRWLIEQRLQLTDGLGGSCDAFDTWNGRVVDWKLKGKTGIALLRNGKLPPRYRVQLHTYAAGWEAMGREVIDVALVYFPRNDSMTGQYSGSALTVWTEPYDFNIVRQARQRYTDVTEAAVVLDVEDDPSMYQYIPASPSDDCRYCPFWAGAYGVNGVDTTGSAPAHACPGAPPKRSLDAGRADRTLSALLA